MRPWAGSAAPRCRSPMRSTWNWPPCRPRNGSWPRPKRRPAPMGDFLMPSLGADMEHGKIVEWLVKPGDYVRRGDLVAVVDTDKTVMDVESFQEGVVADLLVEIGETVPVGTPLARITQTPAEVGPPSPGPPPRPPSAQAPPAAQATAVQGAPPIAPPVRHLAHRLGVDTGRIHGTGKGGAITRADVEHAVAARPPRAGR